ncbi:hypothetical protein D7Z54_16890 [Salibacterium salarium]|uniref:Uncharacterized protein n=1 Tax=Salibacterium salarium TaxID=284579 RepID=A0A3R9QJH9_9BACI|nr:hypothetical protein D7Z54_16890 [Salibacterium salarium]
MYLFRGILTFFENAIKRSCFILRKFLFLIASAMFLFIIGCQSGEESSSSSEGDTAGRDSSDTEEKTLKL